ncbi:MCE family protein [Mycobacterium sp.]|uniref:MCE family protein n=1 Tax=Mycobacterium sp. TaxID=1785 RepID=UPI002D88D338|nr:MCE family protein [Mycobacterium sp.]
MSVRRRLCTSISVVMCLAMALSGCGFQGLNSLPLPGAVGRGSGSQVFYVDFANIGSLESNSPVMINDVIVGSVGRIALRGWHANVEISVKPDTVVPANVVANIGQTSLLGSMHVALNPPLGEQPRGRLPSDTTIRLNKSSTYPSTEQTLAALSAVVNSGGLGQLGDIIHNFNAAVSGREPQIRDLIVRLNTLIGTLNGQRDNIIAAMSELGGFAGTLNDNQDIIARALRTLPPALEVLLAERPNLTAALHKLGVFSDTATRVINETQEDLVTNLANAAPAICALADVGPDIDTALAYAPLFPLGQNLIDRGLRGDFINLFATVDITVPALKRYLGPGTPLWQGDAALTPAPGDPGYDEFYRKFPDGKGIRPIPPWLEHLPEGSPPLHQRGVAPLGVPAPIFTPPPATTPSECG